jgi:hypothetical protein
MPLSGRSPTPPYSNLLELWPSSRVCLSFLLGPIEHCMFSSVPFIFGRDKIFTAAIVVMSLSGCL